MPKEEIGALRYLTEHPEFDGRGVVVCIFDTGVDPGAAGLQVTTDGKPKIIDVIDCTGSGDVDTSRVEKADAEGFISGASGRKLRVNPAWSNPTGEWRVGCKHVYDLVSRGLVSRLKDERKKKWEEQQRRAVGEAVAALAKFDKDTPASKAGVDPAKRERAELEGRVNTLKDLAKSYEDPGPIVDCVVWHDGALWRAALDTTDLHATAGPPAEGEGAGAGAGAAEGGCGGKGALADFKPLTNYAIEHQYATFSELDSCNFVLNVLEEGRLLSIVADCGAHGTHVAGITAAHFPDDPGSNGIAPGAQIISCKIGDTRLGSMETGVGVVRGLIAARQHGAHLINMSYGEPTTSPNQGRFIELATELVRKHNVIFVASAGNSGPALTTVGAPGGTSSALFGVGAYVSPALAAAGHSVLEAPPQGLQYNWSSRGPTADGHVGVAFSAPGGAIAPVPQWTQQKRQLMNGTSMSSPNACGGIALLLSGLLATGGPIAPHRLRRALENTATPLGGGSPDAVLTYGRGMLQVDKAWDYLQRDAFGPKSAAAAAATAAGSAAGSSGAVGGYAGPWYEVEAAVAEGRGAKGRGVYMREPHEATKPQTYRVTVTPKLKDDATNSARLDVEDRLVLESTVPWVNCPPALMVHHAGRSFEVLVDPTPLPPGLHYGEVTAYEVDARERGPLFRVPVTVIKPLQVPQAGTAASAAAVEAPSPSTSSTDAAAAPTANGSSHAALAAPTTPTTNGSVGTLTLGPLAFNAGSEFRAFVAVPPGATWAELTLRAGPYATPKLFLIRATQLRPEGSYRSHELRTQVTLSGGSEYLTSCAVVGGCTLELTLAQFWSSTGASQLDQVELSFYGVQVAAEGSSSSSKPGDDLALDGAEVSKSVLVSVPPWSRSVRIKPDAKLTSLHIPLRPTESSLEPLTAARDALTDGRVVYRLLLTYKTTIAEAGKYKATLPLINKQIYDSPLESQLLLVHDGATKQLLCTQDAGPETTQLKKGEVLLRLALRHDSQELLDKMRNLPLVLKRKLDGSGVAVPLYGSRRDAVLAAGGGGSAAGEMLLRAGDVAPLWLGPLPEDKLPKDATPGRLLTGHLTLGQLKRGGGAAPHKLSISYLVPPAAAAKDAAGGNGAAKDDAEEKAPEEKLRETLRDAKIKLLKELKLADAAPAALYDRLVAELRADFPGHLPLLLEHLKKMDGREAAVRNTAAGLAAVVSAADDVIAAVDSAALAGFLGIKAGEDTPEYRKTKKEMDERKGALVEALATKAAALLEAEKLQQAATAVTEAAAAPAEGADTAAAPVDAFAACMQELRKWVDTSSENAHLLLHARAETRANRYISALKALDKLLSSDDKSVASATARKEVSDMKIKLFAALGWHHWVAQEKALQAVRFPQQLALM